MTDSPARELPEQADEDLTAIAELLAPVYEANDWRWATHGDHTKVVIPDAARIALTLHRLTTHVTPGGSYSSGRLTAFHDTGTPDDPGATIGLYLHLGDLHLNHTPPDGPENHQEPQTPFVAPRDITHSDQPTPESN